MHTGEIKAAESKFANFTVTVVPKPAAEPLAAEPPTAHITEDYSDTIVDITLAAIADNPTEPRTFRQAMNSLDSEYWNVAMDKEIESMHDQKVWSVVPTPTNRNIVGSKWVYRIKTENGIPTRYKARLVAQGFSQ